MSWHASENVVEEYKLHGSIPEISRSVSGSSSTGAAYHNR